MRLYHYSVDSYRGDASLRNDYKQNFRYAEPFLFALRQSREVFLATYFAAMYTGRELVELKLRKFENFRKDAVEAIFEFVREREFPDEPSRLRCVYYCETQAEALAYAASDCFADGLFAKEQVKLLAVEVEPSRVRAYDQSLYNAAQDAIEGQDFDAVFALARQYYAGARSDHPLPELLSDGENRVLEELEYQI